MGKDNSLEKDLMVRIHSGTRRRGCQRKRWMDCILADAGISLAEAAALCRDCESWRQCIHRINRNRRQLDGTKRERTDLYLKTIKTPKDQTHQLQNCLLPGWHSLLMVNGQSSLSKNLPLIFPATKYCSHVWGGASKSILCLLN